MIKYKVVEASAYRKDYKRAKRQGRDMSELRDVIGLLETGMPLPAEYRDHPLKGSYQGYRECHIEPDWLLVYKIDKGVLVLLLARTGTHSELFDK